MESTSVELILFRLFFYLNHYQTSTIAIGKLRLGSYAFFRGYVNVITDMFTFIRLMFGNWISENS